MWEASWERNRRMQEGEEERLKAGVEEMIQQIRAEKAARKAAGKPAPQSRPWRYQNSNFGYGM